MKKENAIKGGNFITLGHGEILQIMSDIAKKLDSESKIINESRKTKDGETKVTYTLSVSGVKKVTDEFVKMLGKTKKPILIGGTKVLYGIKGKKDDDSVIRDYVLSKFAKECVDFQSNQATAKVAYGKVA